MRVCLVFDHPVCAASVAPRLFLTGAATPPHEEGIVRLIHAPAAAPSVLFPLLLRRTSSTGNCPYHGAVSVERFDNCRNAPFSADTPFPRFTGNDWHF